MGETKQIPVKICPLMSKPENNEANAKGWVNCRKEECAVWYKKGRCAFVDIADLAEFGIEAYIKQT